MEFIKSATAYQLKDKVFIQGYSRTTIGFTRLTGTVFVAEDNNNLDLGNAVINALNDCKTGVYHETLEEYDQKKDPMIITTRMKTWNALMKLSKNVHIKMPTIDRITFTPMRFLGTSGNKKGYTWITDKMIKSDLDPEHLGHALLQALALSENPYLEEAK
ncbi:MAG: hypothetical protein JSS34_08880 [Proteobacteria bacterium]|nr:hypothetical protein [Pseudomonadota bacterium]